MARPKKAKAKERLDKYYKLAKEQGLRARSAFKLVQLNRRFGFLQKARTLLDLGAAPGGWLQIAQKTMTIASTIVGVDLMPIKPIPGVKTIVGDFLTEKVRRTIKQSLGNRKADVVLHDGAPNVSGAWDKDAYVQNVLVLTACKLACEFLVKGGVFVTKVFRSSDYPKLMFVLKELFEKAHATKPESSRFTSAEIFIVCIGYKAPRSVDPKFFNPKEVFAEMAPKPEEDKPLKKRQVMNQLARELEANRKKKASGYDAPGLLLYKKVSITDFVMDEMPETMLRNYNEITFEDDGSEDRFKSSMHTTPLLLEACKDLKVLGMWTMKKLLQWQAKLRKEENVRIALQRGDEPAKEDEIDLDAKSDSDKDIEELEGELAEIQKKQERAIKKARRKVVAKKLKQAVWGYNKDNNPVDTAGGEESIFDIADDTKDLEEKLRMIGTEEYDDHHDVRLHAHVQKLGDIHRTKQLGEDNTGIEPLEEESEEESDEGEDGDEEEEGDTEEGDGEPKSEGESEKEEEEDAPKNDADFYARMEKLIKKKQLKKRKRGTRSAEAPGPDIEGDDAEVPGEHLEEDDLEEGSDDNDDPHDLLAEEEPAELQESSSSSDESESGSEDGSRKKKRRKDANHALYKKDNKVASSGFEKLPDSLRDPLMRAKMHAMAVKMLDKRDKRELLESAVNRWCFNDEELPDWFERDERKACFRILPITREEMEEQKARFKAINAMPSKKVMQAIGRRRLKARRILNKLAEKDKANASQNKKGLPSIRQLMRSNKLDKRKLKKKDQKIDGRLRGERYREWTRKKKEGLVRGRGGKKKR
eukprot:EG_transcript_2561